MLLFNKKLTASEACALGLVNEVFPDSTFQKEVWARLKAYASLPKNVSILILFSMLEASCITGPPAKSVVFFVFT